MPIRRSAPRGRLLGRRRERRTDRGPFVGGVLIALVGWRSIFLVNLPIGAAGLWLAWRYAEETPRLSQREIDLPGQIAAITALGTLAGALIEGGRLGWSHPLVIVGFAAAAVVGLLFVWREARAPQPMLPLSLFAHRMFALTALVGVLFNIAFYGLIFRAEPLFPEYPWLVAVRNGPRLRAHDGHGAARQPRRRVGQRAPRRAATIALASVITAVGCVALLPMASDTSYWAIGAQLLVLAAGSACSCRP